MNTAVLMIVFCRPETTRRVFEEVRKAKPSRLYVACDAPVDSMGMQKQNKVLDIFNDIDWDCELKVLRQATNQGCSLGPYKAISWFFSHEDEGIILEDDILPSAEFFRFCEDMLDLYRNNTRVLSISGWNYFYHGIKNEYDYSYYFSHISSSWGWATWKRSWNLMDIKLDNVSESRFKEILRKFNFSPYTCRYYFNIFSKIKKQFDSLSSWDYQFNFSAWQNDMLVIQPMKNLTRNIGVGEGATHEMPEAILNNKWNNIYPIVHPKLIEANLALDEVRIQEEKLYRNKLIVRIIKKIIRIFKSLD